MAWDDEGRQRFEFGFKIGESDDQEMVVVTDGVSVGLVFTREKLIEFISGAQAFIGQNPLDLGDTSAHRGLDPQ